MAYLTRRAYLRSEVARIFEGLTINGTACPIAERTVPTGDTIRGAFRCGNQEKEPVGEGRKSAEAGTMVCYVRVEFRTDEADVAQDDTLGIIEDAVEAAIEAYTPGAKWTHPLSRETVEIRRVENRHLVPAIGQDGSTGFVIMPFVVLFHRGRR